MTSSAPVPMEAVLAAFAVSAPVEAVESLAGGHIHGTWLVRTTRGSYVAQAVNRTVFTDLDACEANLSRLAAHLRSHPTVAIAPMHRTSLGAVHWTAPDGTPWRLADHLGGTVAGVQVLDAPQAFATAEAFGRYVAALATLSAPALVPTLARFHDLPWRQAQLGAAMASDRCGRRKACADLAGAIDDIAGRVCAELERSVSVQGPLPVRAVHNDAKVANVRFDAKTGAVAAIVDLDTTMPGSALFDLGELLRTATVAMPEDAAGSPAAASGAATGAASVDDERVAAVVRGFVAGLGDTLTAVERAGAPWAGPMMAIENAARFAADHLDGDRYFRVERSGQNLDRARTQLAVARALIDARSVVAAAIGSPAT